MKADGEFKGQTEADLLADRANIVASVAAILRAQNSRAWCAAVAAGIDLDKLFEFLEKLITLLIPLIIK